MNRHEELDTLVASLRALGTQKPTPERRAIARDALRHKREGVQSVAAQVLGSWGGRESVDDLRAWLARLVERHESFSGPRNVALGALARCIGPADAGWALDLYFGQQTILGAHEYVRLAASVEPKRARPRIVKELRSRDPVRRHAALRLISWLGLEDGAALAKPLVDDEDDDVRWLAGHLQVECRPRQR